MTENKKLNSAERDEANLLVGSPFKSADVITQPRIERGPKDKQQQKISKVDRTKFKK